jgi:hypothetical protein
MNIMQTSAVIINMDQIASVGRGYDSGSAYSQIPYVVELSSGRLIPISSDNDIEMLLLWFPRLDELRK